MSTTSDPVLAVRWLSQARRVVVATQLLLLGLATAGTDIQLPIVPLLIALGTMLLFDAVATRRPGTPAVHAAFDLVFLAVLLLLTGGSENPLQSFYLVEVALLAVVLPPRAAWAATGAAVLLQAAATLFALDLPGLDEEPHHHPAHLAGHVLAFDLAAIAITAFVGRLSASLRAREAALRASEADRARSEKLAALGTLAAGTAHALGTPLGAIELLAEEMAVDLPAGAEGHEAHGVLVGEVRRCRAILDRMLAGDEGGTGRTASVGICIATWVEAWRQAQSGTVDLTVLIPPLDLPVRGAEEGWRDATWTLLDNARAAGEPIRVEVCHESAGVTIRIADTGPVVPPERLARAGQPFFSAWPDRKGTGLGVYVARTFARAAGGELVLAPCPGGGARAILSMLVEER